MVHQYFAVLFIVFGEKKCFKNILIYLVTLSIPKVAKNGQKLPILDNLVLHWHFASLCSLCDNISYSDNVFELFEHILCKKKSKMTKISEKSQNYR